MKIWIDDVRKPPSNDWVWIKSVNEAKKKIFDIDYHSWHWIEFISLDHDAGDYVNDGGDYIKILDWLEETGRNYPIHIHSMNPVGRENMRRIIQRNGWKEIR